VPTPFGVERIDVRSAAEMADAVLSRLDGKHVFIGVAAVADYTPERSQDRKIKKSSADLTLTLKPTTDILAAVAARERPPYCVGFAAESHEVLAHAEEKRRRKRLPLLIANRAQDALGSDTNEVALLDDAGVHQLPRMNKLAVARTIVGEIAKRLPQAPT
jgi:phosphopantothenoylcysteine decarboxylase/phosphopantothenate--cysteine ligase